MAKHPTSKGRRQSPIPKKVPRKPPLLLKNHLPEDAEDTGQEHGKGLLNPPPKTTGLDKPKKEKLRRHRLSSRSLTAKAGDSACNEEGADTQERRAARRKGWDQLPPEDD